MTRRWRPVLVLTVVLAGCLDEEPTGVGAVPGSAGRIVPATAWLETGSALTYRTVPDGPFSLRPSRSGVVSLAGATATALSPGAVDLEVFVPTGRTRARIQVLPPVPSLQQGGLDQGLTEVSLLGVWSADTRTVFAVGGGGTILLSRDGGQTWRPMDSKVKADLTAVWGTSEQDVYAVGARGAVLSAPPPIASRINKPP